MEADRRSTPPPRITPDFRLVRWSTGEFQAPSLGQSGIKVQLGGDDSFVVTEDAAIVLVDFDVSQSFGHQAGNSGRWVMHPVIKGATITDSGYDHGERYAWKSGVTLPDIGGNPDHARRIQRHRHQFGQHHRNAAAERSRVRWNLDAIQFLLPGTYSSVTPPRG